MGKTELLLLGIRKILVGKRRKIKTKRKRK
jgi:hypothetical protein